MSNKATVYLVHGVGGAAPGSLTRAVKKVLGAEDGEQPTEVLWDEAAGRVWQAGKGTGVDTDYYISVVGSSRQALRIIRQIHCQQLNGYGFLGCSAGLGAADVFFRVGLTTIIFIPVLGTVLPALYSLTMTLLGQPGDGAAAVQWLPWFIYGALMTGGGIAGEALLVAVALRAGSRFTVAAALSGGIACVSLRLLSLVFVSALPIIQLGNVFARAFGKLRGKVEKLTRSEWLVPAGVVGAAMTWIFAGESRSPLYRAAAIGIAAVIAVVLYLAFACLAKIFGDIFHYVADPAARQRVQDKVGQDICAQNPKGPLTFAAHSMGTVVMMDYLANRAGQWSRRDITLITAGSPLRRFFYRFFPNIFFPGTPAACGEALGVKFRSFRWINIYRRLDYVGQKIGLPEKTGYRECRANSFGHTGYWSDSGVFEVLQVALGETAPFLRLPQKRGALKPPVYQVSVTPGTKPSDQSTCLLLGCLSWPAVYITLVIFLGIRLGTLMRDVRQSVTEDQAVDCQLFVKRQVEKQQAVVYTGDPFMGTSGPAIIEEKVKTVRIRAFIGGMKTPVPLIGGIDAVLGVKAGILHDADLLAEHLKTLSPAIGEKVLSVPVVKVQGRPGLYVLKNFSPEMSWFDFRLLVWFLAAPILPSLVLVVGVTLVWRALARMLINFTPESGRVTVVIIPEPSKAEPES